MKKLNLNDTVYLLPIGNLSRNKTKQSLITTQITKIGRKYFTVNLEWCEIQFNLEDWCEKTDYSANYRVYESVQSYEEYKERETIKKLITNTLNYSTKFDNISIEKMRIIDTIIKEDL